MTGRRVALVTSAGAVVLAGGSLGLAVAAGGGLVVPVVALVLVVVAVVLMLAMRRAQGRAPRLAVEWDDRRVEVAGYSRRQTASVGRRAIEVADWAPPTSGLRWGR